MLITLRSKDSLNLAPGAPAGDFTVKLPPHTRPPGAFTVQLVSATILPAVDVPMSLHCSLVTPGPHAYDTHTAGPTDMLAMLTPQVDCTTTTGPVIRCPGAGTWEEVRVRLFDVQTMAPAAPGHVAITVEIDEV